LHPGRLRDLIAFPAKRYLRVDGALGLQTCDRIRRFCFHKTAGFQDFPNGFAAVDQSQEAALGIRQRPLYLRVGNLMQYSIKRSEFRQIFRNGCRRRPWCSPKVGRAAESCIGPDRADLVLAGAAIMAAVQRAWPSERVRVADRGLREGLLLRRMREDRKSRRRRRRGGRRED